MSSPLGPHCRSCGATEADCARVAGCCTSGHGCTHTFGDDCGSERGYQHHRYRKTLPCGACLRAHSEHVKRTRRRLQAQNQTTRTSSAEPVALLSPTTKGAPA